MPEFLGNNWAGAFFAGICVFFYEATSFRKSEEYLNSASFRQRTHALGRFLMAHWGLTLRWWFFVLFMFYLGHTLDLVRQNSDTISSRNADLVDKNRAISAVCESDKGNLRVADAGDKSRGDTLAAQNRDQQNTINSCQTQALKLLTPALLKIVGTDIDDAPLGGNRQKSIMILITNRTVTPVDLIFSCDRPLEDANIYFPGVQSGGTLRLAPDRIQFNAYSPPWTPETPLIVKVTYAGTTAPHCFWWDRGERTEK